MDSTTSDKSGQNGKAGHKKTRRAPQFLIDDLLPRVGVVAITCAKWPEVAEQVAEHIAFALAQGDPFALESEGGDRANVLRQVKDEEGWRAEWCEPPEDVKPLPSLRGAKGGEVDLYVCNSESLADVSPESPHVAARHIADGYKCCVLVVCEDPAALSPDAVIRVKPPRPPFAGEISRDGCATRWLFDTEVLRMNHSIPDDAHALVSQVWKCAA